MTVNIYKVCLGEPHPDYLHHYVTGDQSGFSGNINSLQLEFWQIINFPFHKLCNNSNVYRRGERPCKAFIFCVCWWLVAVWGSEWITGVIRVSTHGLTRYTPPPPHGEYNNSYYVLQTHQHQHQHQHYQHQHQHYQHYQHHQHHQQEHDHRQCNELKQVSDLK